MGTRGSCCQLIGKIEKGRKAAFFNHGDEIGTPSLKGGRFQGKKRSIGAKERWGFFIHILP